VHGAECTQMLRSDFFISLGTLGHDRWPRSCLLDFAGLRLVQSFSVLFQGRPSYAWRAPSPSSNSLGLIGGHQDRVSSLFLSSLYNAAAHHNTKRWWSIIGSSASVLGGRQRLLFWFHHQASNITSFLSFVSCSCVGFCFPVQSLMEHAYSV